MEPKQFALDTIKHIISRLSESEQLDLTKILLKKYIPHRLQWQVAYDLGYGDGIHRSAPIELMKDPLRYVRNIAYNRGFYGGLRNALYRSTKYENTEELVKELDETSHTYYRKSSQEEQLLRTAYRKFPYKHPI